MTSELRIRSIRLAPAFNEPDEHGSVFKGWVSGVFADGIVIDGFGLHCSARNEHTITFPARKGPNGKLHNIVRTTSPWMRDEIERRLLDELRRQRVIP